MRRKLFLIVFFYSFMVFEVSVWGLQNPSVGGSKSRRGVVPPTTYQRGLIRTPNPIDRSSNLTVTGNVGGGKHFRGSVPYNAIGDFGGRLGSGTLDSFLRYSTGSSGLGGYTGKLTPFYSRTGTVTGTTPGRRIVSNPSYMRGGGRSSQVSYRIPYGGVSTQTEEGTGVDYLGLGFKPMSPRLQEMESKIISEVGPLPKARVHKLGSKQLPYDKSKTDLKLPGNTMEQLRRKLVIDESGKLSTKETGKAFEVRGVPEQVDRMDSSDKDGFVVQQEKTDIYDLMEKQIGELSQDKQSEPVIKGRVKSSRRELEAGETEQQSSAEQGPSAYEQSNTAKAILGKYESFAALADDKFNLYMEAGERYLQKGKYYKAVDAYTLASIYKGSDPLAYAGKGHALFAAGEYVSSALFLSRAIEMFPGYVKFKIDIVKMVADKDTLESRISDINEWVEKSDAAELHFLLGYIYYQMDRLDLAKISIDRAHEKVPDSVSVTALKEAIVEATR